MRQRPTVYHPPRFKYVNSPLIMLISIILISLKGLKMENKLAVGTAPVGGAPAPQPQNAASTSGQKIVLMPITHSMETRPVPGVKCLSATQIIIGSFLVVLGIIAAVLQARTSHSGNPIWTGLLVSNVNKAPLFAIR